MLAGEVSTESIPAAAAPAAVVPATHASGEAAARRGGRVSLNWSSEQGELLFDEAMALGIDVDCSDNKMTWEMLTQNLLQKHGVSRSISANKDHLKEMISLMKGIKCKYAFESAAALAIGDSALVRKYPSEPSLKESPDSDEADSIASFKIHYDNYSSAMYDWCCFQEKARLRELLRIPSWWSRGTMIVVSWYVWDMLRKRQIGARKSFAVTSEFLRETETETKEGKRKQEERDTADKEEREFKRQMREIVVESTADLKEMKDGFLRMVEHICNPAGRDSTPPQLPAADLDDRTIPLESNASELKDPLSRLGDEVSSLRETVSNLKSDIAQILRLKSDIAQILRGQGELRDVIALLVNKL